MYSVLHKLGICQYRYRCSFTNAPILSYVGCYMKESAIWMSFTINDECASAFQVTWCGAVLRAQCWELCAGRLLESMIFMLTKMNTNSELVVCFISSFFIFPKTACRIFADSLRDVSCDVITTFSVHVLRKSVQRAQKVITSVASLKNPVLVMSPTKWFFVATTTEKLLWKILEGLKEHWNKSQLAKQHRSEQLNRSEINV